MPDALCMFHIWQPQWFYFFYTRFRSAAFRSDGFYARRRRAIERASKKRELSLKTDVKQFCKVLRPLRLGDSDALQYHPTDAR